MSNKTILLVDGDLVAYVNAAAIEKRQVAVTHLPSGRCKTFNTRTEFKESLEAKNFVFKPEDYKYRDIQIPGSFSLVERNIRNLIGQLKEACWPDEVEVYLGDESLLFRHQIPLPTPYKDNRGSSKPVHLKTAKEYLCSEYNAQWVNYIETDDKLTIRAYQELEKGNHPIIATLDKDAMQSQGVSVLNWNLPSKECVIHIDSLGEIHKQKAAVKGSGLKFLAYQTLAGDPTDTYKPYHLSEKTYGATRAYNAVANCKTEEEVIRTIIEEYKKLYPNKIQYTSWNGVEVIADWKLMLRFYWQCSYMMRSDNDTSNFWEFAAKYNVRKEEYAS